MNALMVYALIKSKVSALTDRAETAAASAEGEADRAEAAATIAQNLSQTVYMDSDDGLFYIDIAD